MGTEERAGFYYTSKKKRRRKMQSIISKCNAKRTTATYATHGQLTLILLYRTRPHTHTHTHPKKPSEKEEEAGGSIGLSLVRRRLDGAGSSSCWSPVCSSSCERWRRSRRFRRRVRVREEARADGRKASQRTKGKSLYFLSLFIWGVCVCVCEASSDRVELE